MAEPALSSLCEEELVFLCLHFLVLSVNDDGKHECRWEDGGELEKAAVSDRKHLQRPGARLILLSNIHRLQVLSLPSPPPEHDSFRQ